MHKTKFINAIKRQNLERPPVWFMRQAGRYHAHYQNIRRQYSFEEVCKVPEVACEASMGPIRDFDFDAAILFSDILFPLETMGIPLTFDPGPKLGFHIETVDDLARLRGGRDLVRQNHFQAEAMSLLRKSLSPEKGLIGFVGAPLTLFYFAAKGSHKLDLADARKGLEDGRYDGFCELLIDYLAGVMAMQANAGADVMAVFDTCAGDLMPRVYQEKAVPVLEGLLQRFKAVCPDTPVIYYSKGTSFEHWDALTNVPFECLGVDSHADIGKVLERYAERWSVQGNFDQELLQNSSETELRGHLENFFGVMKSLPKSLQSNWICGLGHGILPKTPEANVKQFIAAQREAFA